MSMDIVCIFKIIYVITMYHYIAANLVVEQKILFIIKMVLLIPPELLQFIFFQEIFHRNSHIIHRYCFSQYQKYLC